MIHHSRPCVGKPEIAAVTAVLKSSHLAQGPQVELLERTLAARVGQNYGIAVSSGTAALYLALAAMGIRDGDGVVVPVYTCTAVLNAVLMTRANVILADVDPNTGNITNESVRRALRNSRKARAVIVPHMFGYPADIPSIRRIGLAVVEDCAQCVGATLGGRMVGGLSDVSVFSFYATKLISAGEGGLIATSDPAIAEAARDFREYDKRQSYIPAFNLKMSDIHAAIAVQQLARLNSFVRKRRALAEMYNKHIGKTSFKTITPLAGSEPVYYRYVVRTQLDPDLLVERMAGRSIECARPVFKPLHLYLKRGEYPNADRLYNTSLSLPVYPGLSSGQVAEIVRALGSAAA